MTDQVRELHSIPVYMSALNFENMKLKCMKNMSEDSLKMCKF